MKCTPTILETPRACTYDQPADFRPRGIIDPIKCNISIGGARHPDDVVPPRAHDRSRGFRSAHSMAQVRWFPFQVKQAQNLHSRWNVMITYIRVKEPYAIATGLVVAFEFGKRCYGVRGRAARAHTPLVSFVKQRNPPPRMEGELWFVGRRCT